jgi:hypothetical protein
MLQTLPVVDELREQDPLLILDSLCEPDLAERAANERAQSHEAAVEYVPRAACDSDVSRPENLERHDGRVDQVSQLVCEETQALGVARRGDLAAMKESRTMVILRQESGRRESLSIL